MPNGAQTASQAAPASQTGQTGSRHRGPRTPATLAVTVTSSASVGTSAPPRMYVRPAAAGTVPHSRKPVAQVVDVRDVVVVPSAAQHHEPAARDLAEDLEQPPIARPVDARRPRDHQLDAGARRGLAPHLLAKQLAVLIHVAWLERRVFVGRRMLDVAMHADGAAMDDTPAALLGRHVDERGDGVGIDVAIGRRRQARFAIERADVVDDVDAGHRAPQARSIGEVAGDHLDAGLRRDLPRVVTSRTTTRTSSPRAAR